MIGSTAETARKRPERPWTAARTISGSVKAVSPRPHCPATCALRNCSFNCCAGQSHYDNVRCRGTAVDEQLGQLKAKDVQLAQPSSTSLLSHDLFWAKVRVQLHLPPLRSLDLSFDLAWNPERMYLWWSLCTTIYLFACDVFWVVINSCSVLIMHRRSGWASPSRSVQSVLSTCARQLVHSTEASVQMCSQCLFCVFIYWTSFEIQGLGPIFHKTF